MAFYITVPPYQGIFTIVFSLFFIYIFVLLSLLINKISTPDIAKGELTKLSNMAHDVLHPVSRRNLRKRRMEINVLYDRLLAKLNFMGNQEGRDQAKWQKLASQCKSDRKMLAVIKEKIQESDLMLF